LLTFFLVKIVTGSIENNFKFSTFQVISASGGNIIAVANPALSMSPAMLEEEAKAARQVAASPLQLLGLGQSFKQEPLSPTQ